MSFRLGRLERMLDELELTVDTRAKERVWEDYERRRLRDPHEIRETDRAVMLIIEMSRALSSKDGTEADRDREFSTLWAEYVELTAPPDVDDIPPGKATTAPSSSTCSRGEWWDGRSIRARPPPWLPPRSGWPSEPVPQWSSPLGAARHQLS